MSPLAPLLAERVAEARSAAETPEGLDFVRSVVLAGAAVAVAAPWADEVGRAPADGGSDPGGATAWGFDAPTGAAEAALRNGWRSHLRAQDDTFPAGTVHPGAAVLPAALATAEVAGGGGADLCAAILVGYEVTCLLSGVPRRAPRGELRSSSAFSPLGAAAAAAVARGADPEGVVRAVALAASSAGGSSQTWFGPTDDWAYQLGAASAAGVLAAQAAALLPRSPVPDAVEGGRGLWAGLGIDPEEAMAHVAATGRARDGVTLKPYPACEALQSAVSAVLSARARAEGRRPARLEVGLSTAEASYPGLLGRPPFDSRGESLLSAAHAAAVAWRDGDLPLAALRPDAVGAYAEVLGLVAVRGRDDVPFGAARVEVTWTDGGTTVATHDAPRPVTPDRAEAISTALWAECGLDEADTGPLAEAVASLPTTPPKALAGAIGAACQARDLRERT